MAGDWRSYKLGELTDWCSGGTPSKSNTSFWNGDIPWISAKSMKSGRFGDSDLKITDAGLSNGSRLANEGSTLLLVRGSELHKRIPVGVCTRNVAFNQDVKCIVARENLDPEFLYYWLSGKSQELLGKVENTGIGAGKLDTGVMKNLDVLLPSLSTQRTIVSVVKALDDKIELNRLMNETLEAMARAIFKSWFVDFDPVRVKAEAKANGTSPDEALAKLGIPPDLAKHFPDDFQESELGMIPKGWEVGEFSQLGIMHKETINPSKHPEELFDHYSLPSFDSGRMPSKDLGSSIKSNKTLIADDAILLSKLNPRIPRIWRPVIRYGNRPICSTEFLVIRPSKGITSDYLFSLVKSQDFQSVFGTLVTGTSGSHQRVKPSYLEAMNTIIPPEIFATSYTSIVAPILEKMDQRLHESAALINMRDVLLPKLLSGELRVEYIKERLQGVTD